MAYSRRSIKNASHSALYKFSSNTQRESSVKHMLCERWLVQVLRGFPGSAALLPGAVNVVPVGTGSQPGSPFSPGSPCSLRLWTDSAILWASVDSAFLLPD